MKRTVEEKKERPGKKWKEAKKGVQSYQKEKKA
jgi:hypothetical protein